MDSSFYRALFTLVFVPASAFAAGSFSVTGLSSDGDCGITAAAAFTHAINVSDVGNSKINGAVFTGSGTGSNPSTNNYATSGLDVRVTGFNALANAGISGAVGGLMSNYLHNGTSSTITLNNLRLGQQYETVFYCAANGPAGGRLHSISTSDGGSTTFDENGLPGSLLRYTYTAVGSKLTLTLTSSQTNNTFQHYAFSNRLLRPTALLTDNFYVPLNPSTSNLNFNLVSRQGGSTVADSGPISWLNTGDVKVGATTGGIDAGNYLLTGSRTGIAVLNHDFSGADATGGIGIAFDLAPDVTAAAGENSAGLCLGQAEADKFGAIDGSHPHFGVRFRGSNGLIQAFDGNTNLTPMEPWWGSIGVTTQLHRFEILVTDVVDGNPFDGVNDAKIEVFADGLPRFTYTKVGGYTRNFINFQSSQSGGIDNLVISNLQLIPTVPTITLQPSAQSVWIGDSLSLSGAATGYPLPTYQWFRDGVAIVGATKATYAVSDATNSAGMLTLQATNSKGTATSTPALVSLIFPTPAQRTWEPMGACSRRTGFVISEIHYHPPTRLDGKNLEFIELYNANPWSEDLTGWRLTGDVNYDFPAGTQILGKSYLVIAKVPADVQAVYGLTGVLGGFPESLSNQGGTLRLRKPSEGIVLAVSWNDRAPWPVAADGTGHSLVLARPSYGEDSPKAWDASARLGGSPGAGDTPPSSTQDHVVFNEVLSRPVLPTAGFLELRNEAPAVCDISGCQLSDDPEMLGKFVLPVATLLSAGGTISFTEAQLGFTFKAQGAALYFTNATGTRVLDAVRYSGAAANLTLGRANDRAGLFCPLATATPNAPNSAARTPEVLISEIFFKPISGDDLDEWLELYNPGTASVDLSSYVFVDGINFSFPPGTSLAGGSRLVVAKNAARTRANHPLLSPSLVVGDYSGTLGNSGDRLRLIRREMEGQVPVDVAVDTITYGNAGRWSHWAAGGGSSLEVTDLRADRTVASCWADSDETAKAAWSDLTASGPLELGHPSVTTTNRVQFFLMGEGEALVDDVSVVPLGGSNRVSNGGFERGVTSWTAQGNQSRSGLASGLGFGGGAAFRVTASGDGEPDGNRIYAPLSTNLTLNSSATLSAKARWQKGSPEMILRLRGGFLESLTKLPVPTNLGTPGSPNSRAVVNAGPSISEVSHRPLFPASSQRVRVFARVSDPDGVTSVRIRWRLETKSVFATVSMRDDGLSGDMVANDGVYTGFIPGQSANSMVVWHLETDDAATLPTTASFPPDNPAHECLVRFGETPQTGDFATYRLWITSANLAAWTNREKFSNEPIDTTFVYNGVRAVYGGGSWYAGSEASTPSYNGPTNNLCGYNLILPSDEPVLAEDHFTLDWPVRDTTDQREQLMFWMAEQLRLPNLHRRHIQLSINGLRRGTTYNDVQQPGQVILDEFFPSDNGGHLYKTSNWTEGDDDANTTSSGRGNYLQHYNSGGQHQLSNYRWTWRPRAASSANEFGDIFALIDATNATSNYQAGIESLVDTENWMRTFAFHDLCSYWDAFGNPNTKNTYLYKPTAGRWTQFTWDMDVGLGVFLDPPNAELFPVTVDPKIDALQQVPAFQRIYWRTLQESLATFFSGAAVTPLLQKKYSAFVANNLGLDSPFIPSGVFGLSIPQWIDQRRAFLQTQLNTVSAAFAITSPTSVTVSDPLFLIAGTAPVNVARITVNHIEFPLTWNTVTGWSMAVVPTAGMKTYVVRAYDSLGAEISSGTVTANFTGVNAWPALRINEWMASNKTSLFDPADNHADDWLELYNPTASAVNLTGWRLSENNSITTEFSFPPGYTLNASGRLLAWCDNETIQSAPPLSLHLPFKLSASGKTLTLAAPDGTVVDTVSFGNQITDVSQGRTPDGGTTIDFLAAPSAGAANSAAIPATTATVQKQSADTVAITVNTSRGFSYRLEASQDLTVGSWITVGSTLTATTQTLMTFTDSLSTFARRYYRVVRTP